MIAWLTAMATSFALHSLAAPAAPAPSELLSATHPNARQLPADPFKEFQVWENTFVIYSECAGEEIEVTQTVHFRIIWVTNKNRNNSTISIHRSGTGVGLTTGTQYIIRGNYMDAPMASMPEHNGQFTFTLTEHFELIAPGGGNNLSIRYKAKYVTNAKGDTIIDSFFGEQTTACH